MKHSIRLLLLFLAASSLLFAKHVPKKVMYHYCTEVASARYNVPITHIHAQMPVYTQNGFTVKGNIRLYDGRRDRFTCRYDAYGIFKSIKKHTRPYVDRSQRRIKRICKAEASVRWHTPKHEIEIADIKRLVHGRYRITLESDDQTGICEVNRQGYVNRFQTLSKRRYTPHIVKNVCIRKAASRWNIPRSYIEIERADYLGRGRYLIEVSGDIYRARCEVRSNGMIDDFSMMRQRRRW